MNCVVEGCFECPMFYDGREHGTDLLLCNHPAAPTQIPTPLNPTLQIKPIYTDDSGVDMTYIEWVVNPDWCPLKKENLTIVFDDKD